MLDFLPAEPAPNWLRSIDLDSIGGTPFPVDSLLENALFYPACALDCGLARMLVGNVYSFIHVDSSLSRGEALKAIREHSFSNYRPRAIRELSHAELQNVLPPFTQGEAEIIPMGQNQPERASSGWVGLWAIYARENGLESGSSPDSRFSVIYLIADEVATFRELYFRKGLRPKVLALIDLGPRVSGKWRELCEFGSGLHRMVLDSSPCAPDFLLFGGVGPRAQYSHAYWPEYSNNLMYLRRANGGNISVRVREASR